MSTNLQNNKRVTKQIRVSIDIHRKLKLEAVNQNKTISNLADYIVKNYLEKNNNQNYYNENNIKQN